MPPLEKWGEACGYTGRRPGRENTPLDERIRPADFRFVREVGPTSGGRGKYVRKMKSTAVRSRGKVREDDDEVDEDDDDNVDDLDSIMDMDAAEDAAEDSMKKSQSQQITKSELAAINYHAKTRRRRVLGRVNDDELQKQIKKNAKRKESKVSDKPLCHINKSNTHTTQHIHNTTQHY